LGEAGFARFDIRGYSCQFVAHQIFLFKGFLPLSALNSQEKVLKKTKLDSILKLAGVRDFSYQY
jgi:hypothetical protein